MDRRRLHRDLDRDRLVEVDDEPRLNGRLETAQLGPDLVPGPRRQARSPEYPLGVGHGRDLADQGGARYGDRRRPGEAVPCHR
ncbi:MAG: hypothetical protein MZV63_58950 [Marinilabiliales bacterium]|nr:hypothetical protein [Marinilabiliales bacterium]